MPRKPTRLKYFGIAVRRRTLYALTVFFGIISVPTVSWAILVQQTNVVSLQKDAYIVAATMTVFCAFWGWVTITRHNPIFYRDEARNIWLGGLALLVPVTWLGGMVADTVIKPNRMAYGTPLMLGAAVLLFLIVRLIMLGQHPKRGDIVRGESGPMRKKSRPPVPGSTPSPLAADAVADETDGDEGIDDDSAVEEDSVPPKSNA